MERINRLVASPVYQEYLKLIAEQEQDRVFCKHDFGHCLEVARLCWIFLLETGTDPHDSPCGSSPADDENYRTARGRTGSSAPTKMPMFQNLTFDFRLLTLDCIFGTDPHVSPNCQSKENVRGDHLRQGTPGVIFSCPTVQLSNCPTIFRDLVYGAALLHDIGRWMEYNGQGCHAVHGARLADPLLAEAGYNLAERKLITDAIAEHRKKEDDPFTSALGYYLRKADKNSRLCYNCSAGETCYKREKMPQSRQLLY